MRRRIGRKPLKEGPLGLKALNFCSWTVHAGLKTSPRTETPALHPGDLVFGYQPRSNKNEMFACFVPRGTSRLSGFCRFFALANGQDHLL
jgi:hypothetical protein